MEIRSIEARGIRFAVEREGKEVGHAYLYMLQNDLHQAPFGLLEDVEVMESWQGRGIGNELVSAALAHARQERCYKIIATSRNDGTRQKVHDWYARLGFSAYGTEFRIDLE